MTRWRGRLALLVVTLLGSPSFGETGPDGSAPADGAAGSTGSSPLISMKDAGFQAVADPGTGSIRIEWATNGENHEGFHVYRSLSPAGVRERRTDELVCGETPCVWVDAEVEPSTTYFYEIGAVDGDGQERRRGPVAVTASDAGPPTALAPGHPNPFASHTEIRFTLAHDARAIVTVHDISGWRVATLADDELPAGSHSRSWDGLTRQGLPAAAGIYFVQLQTAELTQTRKIVRISPR